MYKRNFEVRSRNQCCCGKATSISAALYVWDSTRMCILYCRLWPVRLYHILHMISQTVRFSGKLTEHKACVDFSLEIFSETFVILRRNERDIIVNLQRPSCKVPVILVRFKRNLISLDRLLKNTQTSKTGHSPTNAPFITLGRFKLYTRIQTNF
jgi:hypothetical protein